MVESRTPRIVNRPTTRHRFPAGRADTNFVSEDAIGKPEARTGNAPTCLFIAGTEARRKGLEVVLGALRLLRDRGVSVRLLMIAASDAIAERIKAEGLDSMVETRRYMAREEVLSEMRRSELFL